MLSATMQVKGTDYKTPDGTCIRDYIDVTDLVDAHVKALEKAKLGKVGIYNVGTGKGTYFNHSLALLSQFFPFPQNFLSALYHFYVKTLALTTSY